MTRVLEIELPYSTPPLSANQRLHWAQAAKIKKQLRQDARVLARFARLPKNLQHVTVGLRYQPRDRRRRDPSNILPTQKPLLDGLVDYGLVPDDDQRFVTEVMPEITQPAGGQKGRMWLVVTID